jgi:hypothetical protein
MGSKINKIIYIDDEEYVWCAHEKEYIINTEFEINKVGQYKQWCEKCLEKLYSERAINYMSGAKDRADYIEEQSKQMLINLGYDYNSQYSIHEQFLMKHNLI